MKWRDLVDEYRKKKGWTIKETVFECGVHVDTLFGRNGAGAGPSLKRTIMIMRKLDIPFERLSEVEL